MDIRLPDMSGIDCTTKLRAILPELPIIMLTGFPDSQAFFRSLMERQGFSGQACPAQELLTAIDDVLKGEFALGKQVVPFLIQLVQQVGQVTQAERFSRPRSRYWPASLKACRTRRSLRRLESELPRFTPTCTGCLRSWVFIPPRDHRQVLGADLIPGARAYTLNRLSAVASSTSEGRLSCEVQSKRTVSSLVMTYDRRESCASGPPC